MRDWKHSQWQLQHLLGKKVRSNALRQEDTNVCTQTSPLCLPVQTAPAATARQPQMRDWKHSQWQLQHLLGRKVRSNALRQEDTMSAPRQALYVLPVQTAPAATARQPQMRDWKHSQWQFAAFVGGGSCAAMLAAGRHNVCTQTSPLCLPVQTAPRRNSKAATDEGFGSTANGSCRHLLARKCAAMLGSRKTQCLHPDKPSMFACAGTAPAATARQPQMRVWKHSQWQVAAFVGEEVRSNACSRKTQCLHPDKPSMFCLCRLPPP